MSSRKFSWCVGLWMGVFLSVAAGASTFEESVEDAGITWSKVGEGTGHFARFIKVYRGALYRSGDSSIADVLAAKVPYRFDIEYLRTIKREDLMKAGETWLPRNLSPDDDRAAMDAHLKTLNGLVPGVKKGDRYTLVFQPDKGLSLAKNKTVLGTIDDGAFARAYLAIWFGDNPSNPELKKAVLGK